MYDDLILWAELGDSKLSLKADGSLIETSDFETRYTQRGLVAGYEITLMHKGLRETRHVFGRDLELLAGKINNLGAAWTKRWIKEQKNRSNDASKEEAARLTREAGAVHEELGRLLIHTLDVDDAIDFETLKDRTKFPKTKPKKPSQKKHPQRKFTNKPSRRTFEKEIGFFEGLFGGRAKIIAAQQASYESAVLEWEKAETKAQAAWEKAVAKVDKDNVEAATKYDESLAKWEQEKRSYLATQASINEKVDTFKKSWQSGDIEAVEDYCRLVLSSSEYPTCLPSEFDLQFNPDNGMLVVEFRLPSIDDIPSLSEVTFIASRGELKEKHLPDSKRKQIFNDVCYQISLRTIHELFEADVKDQISAISFNGFVSQRSSATGKLETSCIMTLQTSKDEFVEIDLSHVDPKECFKGLKGVGSANLAGITPVKPLLELDKADSRFQEGYEVTKHLDDTTNLAAMDWLDFEHLVRELFEVEFAVSGGEVKVTQASADKGVDAIAFDPDPIRGGKIVIQAKRYTNVVGVSAVRDLYGTLMNEGANKGILVTTSDYGPDSYDFAKDKPITLLNGGNLLSLLEKHGTKATIDIKAAKAELASSSA